MTAKGTLSFGGVPTVARSHATPIGLRVRVPVMVRARVYDVFCRNNRYEIARLQFCCYSL